MNQKVWKAVDQYLDKMLIPPDSTLKDALATASKAKLPAIQVSSVEGKLLHLLVQIMGARNILEIGTLGGYSTIWLARGAGPAGQVITIEQDPRHAAVALGNLRRAGVADRVAVRVGAALSVLPDILRGSDQKFDFVFIDADKENDVSYMQWAIRLSRPGAMILVDNVVRFGGVLDPDAAPEDPGARGSRDLLEFLSTAPGIDCTAIQTVGEKGWDGFLLAVVTGD